MADSEFPRGTVWLVGAGPGDADLLTRKAERLIRSASVIYHDALVGRGILDLAPRRARLVSVGKRSGRHSKDQKTIDALIVEAALAGERVVRLKGGDPSIFGRAAEELDACRTAGVPVHVCPGLTAASAAAASLGRSLTLRGHARRLTFVTAHTLSGEALDLDWQALADPDATLAVYMGRAAAPKVSAGLIAAGMPPETPVAVVENASLPEERRVVTRLDLLPIAARALGEGPAVILIGQAVSPPARADSAALAAQATAPVDFGAPI
jgi:uroporphyrin-III C-methyltransferase